VNHLDDGLAQEWPEALLVSLQQFRLGDLIESPPLPFYGVASEQLWCPSNAVRPDQDGAVECLEAPYGIITTQTCDISERGPSGQMPFIQISPVFEVEDLAGARDRLHLVPLTNDGLPGGPWVADLRVEAAVEKSILMGREPIRAFSSEEEEIEFGELLGRRRDRAALHDAINDVLYRAWRKRRSNNKNRARTLFGNLHSVGLAIQEGTRLEPFAVQCHFIGAHGPVAPDDQEWIEKWWDKASEEAEKADPALRLLPCVFHDGSKMDLRLYDELIPLDGWLES
jgi:hypothetical protein